MAATNIIILKCILLACITGVLSDDKVFPDEFSFGLATSAYQIEGAWSDDGKGVSMWDHLVHTDPDFIYDRSNGDIACNSYYNYRRDVEMLKELGLTTYRFSVSWTRVLSDGYPESLNPLGIAYYNALIDELLANDIQPFVTMYHWDLPQTLSEQGGWLNETIVDWMADYGRILFENFGDRVKHWITINEPHIHCNFGYGSGSHAPRIYSPGVGFYECGRNILLANARLYHMYNDEFKPTQQGEIGIALSLEWGMASYESEENAEAVLDFNAYNFGHFMDPIFSASGDYPTRMIERVAAASAAQGLNESRLRPFTDEQVSYMQGTADFLALNHYTSVYVYRNASMTTYDIPSWQDDANYSTYADPSWPTGFIPWFYEYAPGLYHILTYIRETYNNPAVYITENGLATDSGLIDDNRVQYLRNYLDALLDALYEGANVKGYFGWSLMDNFEWGYGFYVKFGFYEVDFEDSERTRTPRKSALVYKEIVQSRMIDNDYDPYADEEPNGVSLNSASVLAVCVVAVLNLFFI